MFARHRLHAAVRADLNPGGEWHGAAGARVMLLDGDAVTAGAELVPGELVPATTVSTVSGACLLIIGG